MVIQFGVTVFFNRPQEFSVISRAVDQFSFLKYVEFRGEIPFFFPEITSRQSFEYYKTALSQTPLKNTIHTTMYGINLATLNPWLKEANIACYKRYIELAGELESEVVVVHGGVLHKEFAEGPEKEQLIEQAENNLAESLTELADYAKKSGVTIGLENSPPKSGYAPVRDAASHIKMIEKINHPRVKALLDTAHAFLRKLDIEAYLSQIQPYLCEIHAHNNMGEADDHLGLHEGKIDYTRLLQHPAFEGIPVIMEIKSYEEVVETLKWLVRLGY